MLGAQTQLRGTALLSTFFSSHGRSLSLNRRACLVTIAAACTTALSACAEISTGQLQNIGSKLYPVSLSFSEIHTYAERSGAAYGSVSSIKQKYPQIVRLNSPGNAGVRYFLERDDRRHIQIITIRGTYNDQNWREDLNLTIREDRPIALPVHAGFDRVTRLVYNDVKPYLKPGYKTYLTGHSLGAAVAAILAIYLIEDGVTVERVVTFGEPRFTTTDGAKRLKFLPLIRIVDEYDIVPYLPPSTLFDPRFGPYDQVGPEVILLDGPDFVYLPSHDATRIALGAFWRLLSLLSIPDHEIRRYLARITSKTEGAKEVPYDDRLRFSATKVADIPH
jgi:triacylglycerol lipase